MSAWSDLYNNTIDIYSRAYAQDINSSSTLPEFNYVGEPIFYLAFENVPARIQPRSGKEPVEYSRLLPETTHVIYIDYSGNYSQTNLNTESRILFNSRYFNILNIQNIDEANEVLRIQCRELGSNDS